MGVKVEAIKAEAQRAAYMAILSGTLIRQPCEVCGATRVDAHHPDYSKPLDIQWLCRRHHKAKHPNAPKRKVNKGQMNIRLSLDSAKALHKLAMEQRRTVSATIEILILQASATQADEK